MDQHFPSRATAAGSTARLGTETMVCPPPAGERGFALVLVLVVVGLLVTLVVQFNYGSQVELELARSYVESIQASYLAEAGVHVAMALLSTDDNKNDKGQPIDTLDDQWAQAIPYIPVEEGYVLLSIEDNNRRFDVNRLVNPANDQVDEGLVAIFEDLLTQLGRSDAVALTDSLIDWLDKNDQVTGDGAEEDYYRTLDPPVEIANGPLLSASELQLVKGFDDKLLYGGEEVPGLLQLVTTTGDGTLNVNTADPDPDKYPWILTSLVGIGQDGQEVTIDETKANDWRGARAEDPFASPTDLKTRGILDGPELNALQKIPDSGGRTRLLEAKSTSFTIYATGAVGQGEDIQSGDLTQKSVTAVVTRDSNGKVKILYWREQ
jgi:type II secretory pathway component PulK